MVTTVVPEPTEPRIEVVKRQAEAATRTLIAGHEVGAIRRIVLYLIVAIALGAQQDFFIMATGIVAIVLLATTDLLR